MFAFKKRYLLFVVLASLSLLFSGCTQDTNTILPSTTPTPTSTVLQTNDPTKLSRDDFKAQPSDILLGDKIPIMGQSVLSSEQLSRFTKSLNSNYNPEIAKAFLHIGSIYNLRGDIAFCQSIHETGAFKNNQSKYNNFAGIGGSKSKHYASIDDGVRAQIQLLFFYVSKDQLPKSEPDTGSKSYIKSANRGLAPLWIDLGGFWAMPGYDTSKYKSLAAAKTAHNSYGHTILKIYEKASKM